MSTLTFSIICLIVVAQAVINVIMAQRVNDLMKENEKLSALAERTRSEMVKVSEKLNTANRRTSEVLASREAAASQARFLQEQLDNTRGRLVTERRELGKRLSPSKAAERLVPYITPYVTVDESGASITVVKPEDKR